MVTMIYLYAPPSRSLPHTNVLVYEGTLSRNEGYVSTCMYKHGGHIDAHPGLGL